MRHFLFVGTGQVRGDPVHERRAAGGRKDFQFPAGEVARGAA